jgi:hypothetical protein
MISYGLVIIPFILNPCRQISLTFLQYDTEWAGKWKIRGRVSKRARAHAHTHAHMCVHAEQGNLISLLFFQIR